MRALLAIILGAGIVAGLYARRLYRWAQEEQRGIEIGDVQ